MQLTNFVLYEWLKSVFLFSEQGWGAVRDHVIGPLHGRVFLGGEGQSITTQSDSRKPMDTDRDTVQTEHGYVLKRKKPNAVKIS